MMDTGFSSLDFESVSPDSGKIEFEIKLDS